MVQQAEFSSSASTSGHRPIFVHRLWPMRSSPKHRLARRKAQLKRPQKALQPPFRPVQAQKHLSAQSETSGQPTGTCWDLAFVLLSGMQPTAEKDRKSRNTQICTGGNRQGALKVKRCLAGHRRHTAREEATDRKKHAISIPRGSVLQAILNLAYQVGAS